MIPLLEQPFGTLPALLRDHAAARPGQAALIEGERTLSFAALDALADRVAAALQRDGVRPREVVALCAANSLEQIAVFLGALRAGAALALLAPGSTPDSLAAMAVDAGARLLFLDGAVAGALEHSDGRLPTRIVLDGSGPGPALDGWLAPAGAPPAPVEIGPDWPFNLIYSSGTTGAPKGIVQAHAMRWAHIRRGLLLGYEADAVTMAALPLYANTALVSFLPALGMGGTVVLMRKFDPAGFLALAERHRATHAMLVPVQFQRLLALPGFGRYDLSSFRLKTCTSAPFPAALKAEVLRRWPGALIEFYGMTEGGASCMLEAREHPDKLHTVGRPQPGHQIRLIDEAGREVPQGEVGEVVGRSPMMMTGYHNLPEKTAEAEWFDPQGLRFIRTGDLGRLDADGFLSLVGRKKDLVISGGQNVYPSDLEEVLRGHPAVVEACVVGVPSEQWGETPVAFVVLAAGAAAAPEELRAWANARLGKMQRLSGVELIESLPRGAIGKLLKRELREEWQKRHGR